ncbi:hypothetical protein HanHA300_Chr12g0444731 [Helianthus annuus]|nr:hypothetical protein HanHA300_Chr12g0444731 [Helianthus annuus]
MIAILIPRQKVLNRNTQCDLQLGVGVVITHDPFITHNIQSIAAMLSTIISSLTTFFSGNANHSQHPTKNPHIPSHVPFVTRIKIHALF